LARLSQFHENQALVNAGQSVAGRLTLWAVALVLLAWHEVSPLMMVSLSLVMVFPAQRHALLSVAAAGMIVEKILEATSWHWQNHVLQLIVMLVVGIAGLYTAYLLVKHFEKWPTFFKRFPILTLHAAVWLALSLSTLPMLGVLTMVPFLVWRLSYMVALARCGKAGDSRFRDHLFYLVPVFGGAQTPYGKALGFLSQHEAHDPEAFTRSQLAGIKLLLLAVIWILVLDWMNSALFGDTASYITFWPGQWTLGLSGVAEQLRSGIYPPLYQGWVTVYLELVRKTLWLAVTGHVIIGCLRLLGFNVFRNTYKPLLSESIVEFWNRFYYYFKELLVDFFFYPAYLRMRSLGPRARMFAAVFAAAFLGNMYHHVLARPEAVLQLDLAGFWISWGPRFVYCFLLAAGIWISMLRQQKLRLSGQQAGLLPRLRRIAGVWTFYGIIHIWIISSEAVGVGDRLAFFLSLIGVD
jgi:hypothetical protein